MGPTSHPHQSVGGQPHRRQPHTASLIGLLDRVGLADKVQPEAAVDLFTTTTDPCPSLNVGCGFACTIHANSAREALEALVTAACMAGEHVAEPVIRKLFCSAIDLLVHCDIDDDAAGGGIRRGVREVHAVAPALTVDEVTTEPLLARSSLDEPLRWTGSLPPDDQRWTRGLGAAGLRNVLAHGAEGGAA